MRALRRLLPLVALFVGCSRLQKPQSEQGGSLVADAGVTLAADAELEPVLLVAPGRFAWAAIPGWGGDTWLVCSLGLVRLSSNESSLVMPWPDTATSLATFTRYADQLLVQWKQQGQGRTTATIDMRSGQVHAFPHPLSERGALTASADGRWWASAEGGSLRVYDHTWTLRHHLPDQGSSARVQLSRDGRYLVTDAEAIELASERQVWSAAHAVARIVRVGDLEWLLVATRGELSLRALDTGKIVGKAPLGCEGVDTVIEEPRPVYVRECDRASLLVDVTALQTQGRAATVRLAQRTVERHGSESIVLRPMDEGPDSAAWVEVDFSTLTPHETSDPRRPQREALAHGYERTWLGDGRCAFGAAGRPALETSASMCTLTLAPDASAALEQPRAGGLISRTLPTFAHAYTVGAGVLARPRVSVHGARVEAEGGLSFTFVPAGGAAGTLVVNGAHHGDRPVSVALLDSGAAKPSMEVLMGDDFAIVTDGVHVQRLGERAHADLLLRCKSATGSALLPFTRCANQETTLIVDDSARAQ